jgi:hypothetical protein
MVEAGDPVLGNGTYFYLTTHSNEEIEIRRRMYAAKRALDSAGASVLRMKIEEIVLDTRFVLAMKGSE